MLNSDRKVQLSLVRYDGRLPCIGLSNSLQIIVLLPRIIKSQYIVHVSIYSYILSILSMSSKAQFIATTQRANIVDSTLIPSGSSLFMKLPINENGK